MPDERQCYVVTQVAGAAAATAGDDARKEVMMHGDVRGWIA